MITSIEQCDKAIIESLRGLVIDDKPVPVHYISPQKEFKPVSLPAIAVYRSGSFPNFGRWVYRFRQDNFREENGVLTFDEYEPPTPFDIYYGIRIYYDKGIHGAKLNTFIVNKFRRGSYLVIEDDYCDLFFVNYFNPNSTYKDFGEFTEKAVREFTEQYLYKLEISLINNDIIEKDEDRDNSTKVVLYPHLEVHTKNEFEEKYPGEWGKKEDK